MSEKIITLSVSRERIKRHFPIFKWLPFYKKTDFLADTIAGLTLGLTLIPQSIAYAALAGLSPEYGLYSSFMGSFIYVIFGTIKEVSIGPTSLMSLLTFEFTKDLPEEALPLFTFICGCVVFLLGLLQFGFLVNYISVPVTTSFQSATALIIIASQMKNFLGISKFKTGHFFQNVLSLGERVKDTKSGDLILSLSCCCFLLFLRKLKDIKIGKKTNNSRSVKILQKIMWFISIARNALCVLFSCAIAYYFSINDKTPFNLSGDVPEGFPKFNVPFFSNRTRNETLFTTEIIYKMNSGILILPLIAVLANITIAKAFSVGSSIDANQEMLALGVCNIGGAFFASMPTCGAFTRSAVSHSSGVRTPLAGLFTGMLVLLVIKFLTPYFYYIPKATLASVLICAVIFMIDWETLFILKKAHRGDFLSYIVTFFSSLLFGVQVGLLLGVSINMGQLLYKWTRPSLLVNVKITNEGHFYLITLNNELHFPATDFLHSKLAKECTQIIPVVIDCKHLYEIDYTAAKTFREIGRDCAIKKQKLLLINLRLEIYRILKKCKFDLKLKECVGEEEEFKKILFQYSETEFAAAIILSNAT